MTEHQRQLLSAYLDDALDAAEAAEFSSMLEGTKGNPQLARTLQTYVAIGEAMRGKDALGSTRVVERVALALRDEPVPVPAHIDPVSDAPVAARAPNVLSMPKRRAPGWQRVVRSVAMAATVAAVAIGGMRLLYTDAELGGDATIVAGDVAGKTSADKTLNGPEQLVDADNGTVRTVTQSDAAGPRSAAPTLAIPPTTLQLDQLPTLTLVSTQSQPAAKLTPADALSTREWDRLQPTVEARVQAYFLQHNEVTRNSVRGMLPYASLVGYESSRN